MVISTAKVLITCLTKKYMKVILKKDNVMGGEAGGKIMKLLTVCLIKGIGNKANGTAKE